MMSLVMYGGVDDRRTCCLGMWVSTAARKVSFHFDHAISMLFSPSTISFKGKNDRVSRRDLKSPLL